MTARERAGDACILAGAVALAAAACWNPLGPDRRGWMAAEFGSELVWAAPDTTGTWWVDPLLEGDRVYYLRSPRSGFDAIVEPARLVAVRTDSGRAQWSSSAGTARNLVTAGSFVAGGSASLEVFDRATGAARASYERGSSPYGSHIATDGSRFYALTESTGRVISFDPVAKAPAWETPVEVTTSNSAVGLAVAGDRVVALFRYVGSPSDSTIVVALDRTTGSQLWRYATAGSYPSTPPVVLGGRAFVVTHSHDVIALSLADGSLAWKADAGDGRRYMVMDGLAACDGRVIVPTGTGRMRALNAETGAKLWDSGDVRMGSNMSVQCLHGTVLVYIGSLRILRASDGAQLVSYPLNEPYDFGSQVFIGGVTRDAGFLYIAAGPALVKVKAPTP